MDFFVWLGARRRHSELWQRRATTPDGERRDLIGAFITGNRLTIKPVFMERQNIALALLQFRSVIHYRKSARPVSSGYPANEYLPFTNN
jgi:hypothetical protein